MMHRTILFALPLALAACGQPEAASDPEAAVPSAGTPRQITQARMTVDANGFVGKDGSAVRFGVTSEEADAKAREIFPEGPIKSSQTECGAGPMEFSKFGPLDLAFLDGKFAGWFLRKGDGIVTTDGIAPGVTTLDALKGERQVQELDTTLEGEFQYTTADYGTITGFADDSGNITALQAGVSCFFR
ncbi:hypothetical protein K3172_10830 [Qipengyuania sp. 6B39]|uniref:hypothetical protein n=1 Tax=Qipengyuania proteolytica TaxID=2867239 RepID=UPI001C8A3E72|nr:hypothetical protein [Qipengyuania proteolytica]MBX7496348.1 hypothetical protein [Qipengyuania proteolytica]